MGEGGEEARPAREHGQGLGPEQRQTLSNAPGEKGWLMEF